MYILSTYQSTYIMYSYTTSKKERDRGSSIAYAYNDSNM